MIFLTSVVLQKERVALNTTPTLEHQSHIYARSIHGTQSTFTGACSSRQFMDGMKPIASIDVANFVGLTETI